MAINFRIKALEATEFAHLFKMSDKELEKIGARRMIADSFPGFPCRVSLADAEMGEEVILLSYQHHKATSPYQSAGPVFVRKIAETAKLDINEIPKMLNHRLLSVRGYDEKGMMVRSTIVEGSALRDTINELFEDPEINYLHIHNAKPGCYNCLVERE